MHYQSFKIQQQEIHFSTRHKPWRLSERKRVQKSSLSIISFFASTCNNITMHFYDGRSDTTYFILSKEELFLILKDDIS